MLCFQLPLILAVINTRYESYLPVHKDENVVEIDRKLLEKLFSRSTF